MGPRLKLKFLSYKEKKGEVEEVEGEEVPALENPEMGGDD